MDCGASLLGGVCWPSFDRPAPVTDNECIYPESPKTMLSKSRQELYVDRRSRQLCTKQPQSTPVDCIHNIDMQCTQLKLKKKKNRHTENPTQKLQNRKNTIAVRTRTSSSIGYGVRVTSLDHHPYPQIPRLIREPFHHVLVFHHHRHRRRRRRRR